MKVREHKRSANVNLTCGIEGVTFPYIRITHAMRPSLVALLTLSVEATAVTLRIPTLLPTTHLNNNTSYLYNTKATSGAHHAKVAGLSMERGMLQELQTGDLSCNEVNQLRLLLAH